MPSSNLVVAIASRTEGTRIVVFGFMKISRARLLAMVSGLRLESEIVSLHTSLTYRRESADRRRIVQPTSNPEAAIAFPSHGELTDGPFGPRNDSLTRGIFKSFQFLVFIMEPF